MYKTDKSPMQEEAEQNGITEANPEMSLEKRLILDAIKRALAIFETCQSTKWETYTLKHGYAKRMAHTEGNLRTNEGRP